MKSVIRMKTIIIMKNKQNFVYFLKFKNSLMKEIIIIPNFVDVFLLFIIFQCHFCLILTFKLMNVIVIVTFFSQKTF